MLHFSFPAEVERLRAERDELLATLRDVLRADDLERPCDHPHDPDNGCTHCYARGLIAEYDRMRAA